MTAHLRSNGHPRNTHEFDLYLSCTETPRGDPSRDAHHDTVIDVGTNMIDDATRKSGRRLVGDVDFAAAKDIAGAITPVPGGVGPMTIAMLLSNTLKSAERSA